MENPHMHSQPQTPISPSENGNNNNTIASLAAALAQQQQERDKQQQQQQQAPPSSSPPLASRNPVLEAKLRQLALPLAPLVQLTTGAVHPAFPSTLLGFWLLTEAQLESLASFYHQRTPCRWTAHYPCPVPWATDLSLDQKRRRIGRFIGLRGCESPTATAPVAGQAGAEMGMDMAVGTGPTAGGLDLELLRLLHGDEMAARLAREEDIVEQARRARLSDEDEIRKKMGWF